MPISYLASRLFVIASIASLSLSQLPDTFKYGTNLGGWLLCEPWMQLTEWQEMGGEYCPDDSASCAASEWSLSKKLGQKRANEVFSKHWQSWFTQAHVDELRALKLDHLRIPLGFWIIEELVKAPAELYPQGGWMELKRGLRQLGRAGFHAVLDMHAMPGVAAANQQFAGNVTSDVQFYKDHNYQRALTWSAVMTAMTHLDPDFESVVGIECINEPLNDANLTPGLGQYYSDFVTLTRVIEYAVGAQCETDLTVAVSRLSQSKNALAALEAAIPLIPVYGAKASPEIKTKPLIAILKKLCSPDGKLIGVATASDQSATVSHAQTSETSSTSVQKTSGSQPDLSGSSHVKRYDSIDRSLITRGKLTTTPKSEDPQLTHGVTRSPKSCIATIAMPKRWQSKGEGDTMSPYTLGPRAYDDHMYFSFGGVADANFESYMKTICNLDSFEKAKKNGELPFGHGEFSLAVNFNATHDEFKAWGDAQRFIHSKGKFWTFWTFRLGTTTGANYTSDFYQSWSYLGAVKAGVWPKDPADYFNPKVCDPYLNSTQTTNNIIGPSETP